MQSFRAKLINPMRNRRLRRNNKPGSSMPSQSSRRAKLSRNARRIPISVTLDPKSHAILTAIADQTAKGNRSAVLERLILTTLAQPPATA